MPVADLLITNARVISLDDSILNADAVAIHDGRFVFVGRRIDAERFANPNTRRLDAAGRFLVPGFQDCHLHLLWFGKSLVTTADLVGCESIDDLLGRLRTHAGKTDGWIVGHGFDQSKLKENRFPTRGELDSVSRDRPMLITRICGHAAVANSAAIRTLTPAEQSAGDAESGLFTETAISPLHANVPPPDDATLERALIEAMNVALRGGITSVQTMLDTTDQMRTYTRLRRKLGRLPIRVVGMPPQRDAERLSEIGVATGTGDEWLRFGAAKFFSDGSLGARTALLSTPYADDSSAIGTRIYDRDELKRRMHVVQRHGFQIAIHAIGDAALDESLDAIEYALAGESNAVHRHRVEHASICRPDQIERLVKLDVPVAIQPQFVTSDRWSGQRVGENRAAWCYPFDSMRKAGVKLGLSSDCPVERLDGRLCLWAATGRHEWSPRERMSPADALRDYTIGSAYLGHREHELGSISPGKFADFLLLEADPTTLSPTQIRSMPIHAVFVHGERVDSNS